MAPWAIEAIRELNKHGLPVTIVTNQSGVADGRFSLGELQDSFQRMLSILYQHDAFIEAIYYCPHSKEDNCLCKKPKSAMLIKAAEFLNVRSQHCFMIGDTGYSDMQAGYSAGCKLILVRTGWGQGSLEVPEYRESWKHITPHYIAEDLLEASHWVCSSVPRQSWKHEHTRIVSL
jgi:histidinol-phosphate phosphatase family protein